MITNRLCGVRFAQSVSSLPLQRRGLVGWLASWLDHTHTTHIPLRISVKKNSLLALSSAEGPLL